MRIDKTLMRLGGVAVAAAVVTTLAPAVVARAAASPAPSPTTTVAAPPSPSTSPTSPTSAPTSAPASPTSATPSRTVRRLPTASVTSSSPTVAPTSATSTSARQRAVAPAATTTASAPKAAAWLVTQLTGGDHLEGSYVDAAGKTQTFADYGGTADVAIALASTGTQDATLIKVVRYLEANVDGYADPKGTEGGPYSGSLGKLALVAEITGQDPHDFGGYDLLGLLTSNVCTAAVAGDYSPCTATGDFANAYSPVSQALDVLALERAGTAVPPTALARLLSLQCANGGFAGSLITTGDTCTSDVDSTGYAEQALVLDPAAAANVTAASEYLLASQQAGGGWETAGPPVAVNANSTALALQALIAGPPAVLAPRVVSASAVSDGEAFLASLQVGTGALDYSAASAGDTILATDQSVPAIAGKTLTTLVHAVSLAVAPVSPTPTVTPTSVPASVSATATAVPTTPVATISNPPAPTGGTLPFTGTNAALQAELAGLVLILGAGLLAGSHALRRRGAHR